MQLQGKVVAVTGAFGALGRAVTDECLHAGARVAMLGHSHGAQPPEGAAAWNVELTALPDVRRVFDEAARKFGRLDALVNVAGGFTFETLEQAEGVDAFRAMFETNVLSCVTACKAVLPHLQHSGAGRIVNVGATGALKGTIGMAAYAASKAGVMRFTEALADELKQQGITVNAVLPSIIDTPANRKDMPKADFGRWVKPQQIAQTVVYLLSDAASAVTGALIPVTGKT